ncbi:MAG: MarR family transcriptional regulator [Oscillibacter sp.]|jgi:DNA-binding MarR family transcriptional regulator|nr:MarR family transcriptional regulator [Oscillibacter sp.]
MDHMAFFGPLLGHSAHLAKEQMRARMSRYDITPTQTHVLLYLTEHGPTTQSTLAEALGVKAPTANGVIDRMEEKGLLVRTVDERDARRRLVRLTEKGGTFVEELKECFDRAEEAIVQGFSREEQELLRSFLRRIIENLEEKTL